MDWALMIKSRLNNGSHARMRLSIYSSSRLSGKIPQALPDGMWSLNSAGRWSLQTTQILQIWCQRRRAAILPYEQEIVIPFQQIN
jgi:hypothetical protein